jgi:hypothetical protein
MENGLRRPGNNIKRAQALTIRIAAEILALLRRDSNLFTLRASTDASRNHDKNGNRIMPMAISASP